MTYETAYYNSRIWVTLGGRLLGGYNAGALRSYVFPLYSPAGALVIQEAPTDHPHHQGIWAGLEVEGIDFWNAGSFDVPRHRQEMVGKLANLAAEVSDRGVTLRHEARWVSIDGRELLKERRAVTFRAHSDSTVVDWHSEFFQSDIAVHLGQTKESGLGLRVAPHWETRFGGRIRNARGDTGENACFDGISPWLSIEGAATGREVAGVIMVPTSVAVPWFTRDYGCHVYNPARHEKITIAPGESLVWSMRVVAYDGARSLADIDALVAATAS